MHPSTATRKVAETKKTVRQFEMRLFPISALRRRKPARRTAPAMLQTSIIEAIKRNSAAKIGGTDKRGNPFMNGIVETAG